MSTVVMILLISLLIIVHEAGHFLSAKIFGVAVPKFGFGLPIGPTLFKKKIGDTEFLLHAFLLGGYVSFLDDEEHPEIPKDSPELFKNKPIWQRMIIVSAGVVANIITAVVLVMFVAISMHSLPTRESDIYITKIDSALGTNVYDAGLRTGDKLYTINETKVIGSNYLSVFVKASCKFNGIVEKERITEKINQLKSLNPKFGESSIVAKGTKVILPAFDNEKPVSFSKNYLIGLDKKNSKMNTITLSEEQEKLRNQIYNKKFFVTDKDLNIEDIATAVSDTVAPLKIIVKRNNETVALKTLFVDESGKIGVEGKVQPIYRSTKTVASIFTESLVYLVETTYLMILGLVKLFTGNVPVGDLHGIIVITKLGADIISSSGIMQGILLTAMISVNLAIMNFLPIPALDGGHLLFLLLEKISGKPVNEKITEKISTVCFILLIILMCFILYNDIFALITNKFG